MRETSCCKLQVPIAWDCKSQAETGSVLKHTGRRPPTCFSMFSVSDAELHSAAMGWGQQGHINKKSAHPSTALWLI